jgi:hypothetical protein
MNYPAWRQEVEHSSGNWLQRLLARALPRQAQLPERQDTAFVRPQSRASWDSGFGFVNPFFKIPAGENLYLNEQMVQMVPPINAAIDRITQLVGCPVVMSDDEAAKEELNEWLEGVRVNRVQTGFSNLFPGLVKAHLTYGRAHCEIIPTARYTDVYALQLLHSRTIEAMPKADGYGVQWVQSWPGFFQGRPLDDQLLLTCVHDMRDDNPNGSSLLFGMAFMVEVYNKMTVSLKNTWERFGTPIYFVRYRPVKEISDPQGTSAREVIATVMTGIQSAMSAKANGQTQDFGAAGDFDVEILGADGQDLDIRIPGEHILQGIVAKTGLPPWMLGYNWGVTERKASVEASLLGEQVAEIRQHLESEVKYLLNLRQAMVGRPFDFDLEWEAPSLIDAMETAQSEKAAAEASAAQLKHDLELARLGMLEMWQIASRHIDELKGKPQAEVEAALPRLLAEPPALAPVAGPGQPREGGGPPTPPSFPGGARSITYSDNLLLTKNGNGRSD